MIADPVLTLAWLALAHLVADFVIQSNRVATEKFGFGRRAWQALGRHWFGAALCLVPFVVAFGLPGLWLLIVVSVAHAVIDRIKILWTMRVEAQAVAEAQALHEGPAPAASLGTAWTPMPAFLFLLDQAAHALVILVAWAAILATAPLTDAFVGTVRSLLASADPTTAHRVALTAVVLLNLAIVNVRAALLFVATLVHPRQQVTGEEDSLERRASPARVGATIGVLERVLIVALVLTNATAAVGFVVAAKTIARFKQLDDRRFAEYYLLGTLASVAVAVGSALIAAAALAPPPGP